MPPTTTIDIAAAQRLLLADKDVGAVAEALGVSKRYLERVFVAAIGEPPATWRRSRLGARNNRAPLVAFRLAEHEALVEAARDADMEPNAWARRAVQAALANLPARREP